MFDSIGFIGAGRIAHIMLGGWQRSGTPLPLVYACDQSADAVGSLQRAFPAVRPATLEEASRARLVFGALHPPAMGTALPGIAPNLAADAVFCSLAPVIRLPALQEKLGGFSRLVRMNPNAPSIVGSGYNPVSFGSGLPHDARDRFLQLMKPLGACPEVDDVMIETYAAISAMGPTYVWFQFDELRRLAQSFGLDRDAADQAVAAMLRGAVATMFAGELDSENVMDLVPVRPMANDETAILGMMRTSIKAIHARLHPQQC